MGDILGLKSKKERNIVSQYYKMQHCCLQYQYQLSVINVYGRKAKQFGLRDRAAEVVAALQPGCEEMERKWRENEEIERKWTENEEMDRE